MDTPMTATGLLAEDHRRIQDIYQGLGQEQSPAARDERIEALLEVLAIHSWLEERLVYPTLAKACGDEGLALRLDRTHGELMRLISDFRLKGGGAGPEGRTGLARIMAQVEEHVKEEEQQAFPLLAAGAAHNGEWGAELVRLRDKMDKFPPFAQAIDVGVPLRVAYNQWTQFEDFPRFMKDVKEVRQMGATRVQWQVDVAGKEIRWTAEIYEQIPDVRIAWRSVEGALNAGSVSFRALDGESTRTLVELIYEPQGLLESLGAMVGVLPRHVASTLQDYKDHLERTRAESGAWRGKVEGTPLEGPTQSG